MEDTVAESGAAQPAGGAARRAAFERLASFNLDRSYRLARLIVGNSPDAEDAVHDAFLPVWTALSGPGGPLTRQRFADWPAVGPWVLSSTTMSAACSCTRPMASPGASVTSRPNGTSPGGSSAGSR